MFELIAAIGVPLLGTVSASLGFAVTLPALPLI